MVVAGPFLLLKNRLRAISGVSGRPLVFDQPSDVLAPILITKDAGGKWQAFLFDAKTGHKYLLAVVAGPKN